MLKLVLTFYMGPILLGLMITKGIFLEKLELANQTNMETFFLGHRVL